MNIQAVLEFLLEGREFWREIASVGEDLPHFDKRAHHQEAHLNGWRAVKYIGSHNGLVLGKRLRQVY